MTERKSVLCVDDETEIIELLAEELNEHNLNVFEANSGNDALEVFKSHKIDCIVSDIRMPNGNGVQLAKNIRSINKDVPIFLITGYLDHSEKEVSNLGINAVVFKPFDMDVLVEEILRAIK